MGLLKSPLPGPSPRSPPHVLTDVTPGLGTNRHLSQILLPRAVFDKHFMVGALGLAGNLHR